MKRKSQMQMNETVMVLFIFFIILIICLSVFYRYTSSSIEASKQKYESNQVYNLLSTLPNSPFLQKSSFLDEEFAVDSSKLVGLDLSGMGYKKILIKEVYPNKGVLECDVGNYPDCGVYVLYEKIPVKKMNEMVRSVVVPLYFPDTNSYKIGLLEVRWYY